MGNIPILRSVFYRISPEPKAQRFAPCSSRIRDRNAMPYIARIRNRKISALLLSIRYSGCVRAPQVSSPPIPI